MDRRQLEGLTASVAIIFLGFITFGGIFFFADQFFSWDLFPPQIEKLIGFVFICSILIIISSVLVNMMINLSIIAINSGRKLELLKKDEEHGKRSN